MNKYSFVSFCFVWFGAFFPFRDCCVLCVYDNSAPTVGWAFGRQKCQRWRWDTVLGALISVIDTKKGYDIYMENVQCQRKHCLCVCSFVHSFVRSFVWCVRVCFFLSQWTEMLIIFRSILLLISNHLTLNPLKSWFYNSVIPSLMDVIEIRQQQSNGTSNRTITPTVATAVAVNSNWIK